MLEKILQKLKDQRTAINAERGTTSNVSDRSLSDLAKSLVILIPDDKILSKTDLTLAITSIDGNINYHTASQMSKATEKAATEAEEAKVAALEVKKISEKKKKKDGEPEIPDYIQIMLDNQEKMNVNQEKINQRLDGMSAEKTTVTRKEMLNTTLKGTHELYANTVMAGFNNTSFKNDEAFTDYLKSIKTNKEAFNLAAKEAGLPTAMPTKTVYIPEDTGETEVLSSARKMAAEAKEKQKKAE